MCARVCLGGGGGGECVEGKDDGVANRYMLNSRIVDGQHLTIALSELS